MAGVLLPYLGWGRDGSGKKDGKDLGGIEEELKGRNRREKRKAR